MKSKAKPAKGSARTKRFDRGGTVAALAGLGTLAFLLNREKNKQKAAADAPDVAKTLTARSAMGEDVSSRQAEDERFVGAEKGDVTAKSDTGSTTPIKKTEKYDPNAGQDRTPVQGVDSKTLDRLQRRNVPSGGKKTTPASGKSSADDVIAAGQRYSKIGRSTKPDGGVIIKDAPGYTSKPTPNMGKDNDARPSKPYPEKQARDNKVMKGGTSLLSAESSKQANESVGRARREQMAQLGTSVKKFFKGEPDTEMTSAERRKGQGLTPYAPSGAGEVRRKERFHQEAASGRGIKKGGAVKKYASGGSVSSASKRADGIAQRGKTRGKVY